MRQRLTLILWLLAALVAGAAASTADARCSDDPSECPTEPKSTATAVPATATAVQLPCVGCDDQSGGAPAAPAAEPAQPAAPAADCPASTENSSDFATFYVACGANIPTHHGPGEAQSGSIGQGTYEVSDRRCAAGNQILDCEKLSIRPNWFLIPDAGWVNNGTNYDAPAAAPAPAPAQPADPPVQPAQNVMGWVEYETEAPYDYHICEDGASTISVPGVARLTGLQQARFTWKVTDYSLGTVIQGPLSSDIADDESFNLLVYWPGPMIESSPDGGEYKFRTITIEGTLSTISGDQLHVAPAMTYTYQCDILGPGNPAPTPAPTPRPTSRNQRG